MKVLCCYCRKEFDWNSQDIFVQPSGTGIVFRCRDCLKDTRAYKKDKITLQK